MTSLAIETKLAILKLTKRIEYLEDKLKDASRYLALQEREYKRGLDPSLTPEEREQSWQAHLDGK